MASRSAAVTHSSYLALTAVCRATMAHRKARLGGSQLAASLSLLLPFVGPSTAIRFSGSFAKARRLPGSHCRAPFCQASDRDTTWSIWTASASAFANVIVRPVNGSASTPDITTQSLVPSRNVIRFRSRRRMSFRVSQPLRSVSAQL